MIVNFLATIGAFFLAFFEQTGRLSVFVGQTLAAMLRPPIYFRIIGQQIIRIGYFSLPVVALTSFFTGGALAIQIYYGGNQFNSEAIVSSIVALGITRELGPVLGGLMVAGRVSAAIAAEIGTMRVTEQIDALVTLSTNPMRYLTVPRVLAATLAVPMLVAVGDAIGIMGGYFVGINRLEFNSAAYLKNTVDFLQFWDIASGLVKGAVFGFIVALMGCYYGMRSGRGAQGVGRATKSAVVASSVLILAANYVLTEVFFTA